MKAGTYEAKKRTSHGALYYVVKGHCSSKLGGLHCGRRKGHRGPHEAPWNMGDTVVWHNAHRDGSKGGSDV